MGLDRIMINTVCLWLFSMYYLTCSPINLNAESPEAWLKIGYVKVFLCLPQGMELARYHIMLLQVSHILLTEDTHMENKKKEKKKDLTYSFCTIVLKIAFMVQERYIQIYSQHKRDLAIVKDCIGELTIVYAVMIHVLWKE